MLARASGWYRLGRGRPRTPSMSKPTYPCPRPGCGREVPVRFTGFRVQHLRHVGWALFRVLSYVNSCGHHQE